MNPNGRPVLFFPPGSRVLYRATGCTYLTNANASDQGFTMDMMLRSLNIDLELIGFDKEGQKWVD